MGPAGSGARTERASSATRRILPLGATRTRRYALNPRALLPAAVNDPDLSRNMAGSSGDNPAQIRIAIDPISLQRRHA